MMAAMETDDTTTTTTTTTHPMNTNLLQDLESEYLRVRNERDVLFTDKQSLQQTLQTTQEEVTRAQLHLSEVSSTKVALEGQVGTTSVKLVSVTEQLRDVQERADRNSMENDKLREELDKLQRSNAALQTQLDVVKVSESANTSNTLKFECERYKTECQALSDHSAYLEGEVSGLREKLLNLKSDHVTKVMEMERRLHSSSDLVFRFESDSKADQERIESYKQLITSLQSKIAERDADIASLSARWESEASNHANLRMMYEHKYELLDSRLHVADNHLKKVRDEAAASAAAGERQRLGYEDQIATLESQVSKQAAMIDDRESQKARVSSRMLNLIPDSESGVKLTEIYDELVTKDDELRQVKAEKAKLDSTFKRVIDEMEQKAPIIAQRQKDYNAMKTKYGQIKNNYEEVVEECSYLRETARSAEEEARQAMMSSEATRRENLALAHQVQNLLKAQLGAGIDSHDAFTNIEELQMQNQQLLQNLYKAESETESIKNETEQKLVEANAILNDFSRMKEERATQQEHVQSLVQQRDMYRALLVKHDTAALSLENGESVETKLSHAEAQLTEKERELIAANDKAARLSLHCESMTSANEEIRNDLLQKSGELAKSNANLSYLESRKEQLERNLSDKNARLINLMSRNDALAKQNEQLHLEYTKLSSQVSHLTSSITDLKSSNQALIVSKSSLESTVGRLNGEIRVLQEQTQQNAGLLTSLQRIELHVQGDAKARIESLEAKITELQEKLNDSVTKISLEETQKQLTIMEMDVASKDKEIQRLTSTLSEATKGIDGVPDIVNKLAEVEVELEDSKKHLETYKQMAKEFEILAKTLEEEKQKLEQRYAERAAEVTSQKSALMNLTSSFESDKVGLVQQISLCNTSLANLHAEVSDLSESKLAIENEKKDLRDEILAISSDLTSMTSNYDRELTLHSQCRIELNKLKKEYSEKASGNEISQTRLTNMQAQLSDNAAAFQTMKATLEEEISEKNSVIDELRTNTGNIQNKISSLVENLTANSEASNSTQDLRSVIEFQQNERRLLDADIISLRGSLEREGVNLRIVQRALDEARAELEVQSSKEQITAPVINTEQLSLLSESNSHLREINAQLSNDLAVARSKSEESGNKLYPLQTELQTYVTKCKEYEAEMEVLKKDADAWKSRTRQIISKFSQIDPVEFDQLQQQVVSLETELKDMTSAKDGIEAANAQAKALIAKSNKDVNSLRAKISESNTTISKLQKEHKDTIAKLSEATQSSVKTDEVESIKRRLLNAEKRAERLTGFLRGNKSLLEQKSNEYASLVKEKDNLSKEHDSQGKLITQLKKEVENLKTIVKKNSESPNPIEKSKATDKLVIGKTNLELPKPTEESKVSEKVTKLLKKEVPKPAEKSIVSEMVTKPLKKVEVPSKPITKVETSPEASGSTEKSVGSHAFEPISLTIVVDQSVPSLPTDGFKFAAGIDPVPAPCQASVPAPDSSDAVTGKTESAESDLRARLMMKKRKLKNQILAKSQKLETVQEKVIEATEETTEPAAKRERKISSSKEETKVAQDQVTESTAESLEKNTFFMASPVDKDDKPYSSPFIVDLKPPSNTSTNLSNLVFGSSANFQLPVPKASPTAAPVAANFMTKEESSAMTTKEDKSNAVAAEVNSEDATKDDTAEVVDLSEE